MVRGVPERDGAGLPRLAGLTILQRSARAFELCRFDGMNRHLNDDQLVEVAIVLANDPNEKMASITAVLELGRRAVGRGDECERLHEALRREREIRGQKEREAQEAREMAEKLDAEIAGKQKSLNVLASLFDEYRRRVESKQAKKRRDAKRRAGRKS